LRPREPGVPDAAAVECSRPMTELDRVLFDRLLDDTGGSSTTTPRRGRSCTLCSRGTESRMRKLGWRALARGLFPGERRLRAGSLSRDLLVEALAGWDRGGLPFHLRLPAPEV
jgi:hypothetical protein